jgi:hypothetical protein
VVNVENVRLVINKIRDEENFFSMASYDVSQVDITLNRGDWFSIFGDAAQPSCKTPACIAGWSNYLDGDEEDSETNAAKFLGLDVGAGRLFRPSHKNWKEITRAEAIAVLENLIVTGEVEW